MKNQGRSNKLQKEHKITLKKLVRNSKVKILALSSLVFASVLGGVLFAWKRPPSNSVVISNLPISTFTQQPVVIKVNTNFNFPASQLPTKFKTLPPPELVSDNKFVHKSTLERNSFVKSTRLQKIIEGTVKLVTNEKLKKEDLSIAVIDVNRNEIAGYQSDRLEYPASVAKLFWALALYEQIDHKLWENTATFDVLAKKMIVESDNEAASFIVDSITKAPSLAKNLEGEEWQDWKSKRLSVNQFFNQSGYEDLDVSQKTYPVPYLNLSEPKGTDKAMRQENTLDKPIRNKVTVEQAAKLMYEVCFVSSLSQESFAKICRWLSRDVKNENWKKAPGIPINDFNPIRGFMGEGVAGQKNVTSIRSKAGWTKNSRQEVIEIKNDKSTLIIAVFANNLAYANSDKIFPAISNNLYSQLFKK